MATREPPVELFYDPAATGRRRIGVGPFFSHHVLLRPRYKSADGAARRERRVELCYDPAELDPDAPRLRIGKNAGLWELRTEDGTVLSRHAVLPAAIDAGLERSKACYSEILFRDASGREEWSVHHNPGWVEILRMLVPNVPLQREAAD